MAIRYRFDLNLSRLTVRAFVGGMLSLLGHSPTFAARDFAGTLELDREAARVLQLDAIVEANALWLTDNVSVADRREIEGSMRTNVLETATYPQVSYQSMDIAAKQIARGRYGLHVNGQLMLHGVTRLQPVDLELLVFDDGIRLRGEWSLLLSDYRIQPVTALGGTIKLKDQLKVSLDIAAVPERA
jgi:polyisoprenoid-binding protein YceI